ncbi:peptidase M16 [Porphyromonas crevioricanis]|uniref:Peptidase M16 n=2 Tax=Porphyromonas crevioricanis TaxID=393921 RepID=A0A0A2FF31_9PORP|nr:M16 family metallopeptidase [Porphyromonas crevioricanis]KGN88650.1 peptidase M16 [Porphyromonas crevioricanis]KGN93181.1 peptidase M16 [Porphyromonas crevioricanis]SJZ96673.1 Predicted Zn-dependent peptidase [Porphyromonas crevioricanis]SQH73746.1 protease3 [Porphyromonas crevioricanis]GAD05033.1 zinc protease [Porphyromonas crevioricanis JCM 15906]
MKIKQILLIAVCLFSVSVLAQAQQFKTVKKTDARGYIYEEVQGDPTHSRMYTLKNGLKVYLSRNTESPRIQTLIPVRTGSNNDPSDNTGLAHYLEHMMFKGTSKMGALNWEKEKVELAKISDLYEAHKATKDPEKRKHLYRQIDSISQIAAQYVAANEYDRLTTSLGATGTNAYTWVEQTVYVNNIPSNQLDRWLQIESERFGELVLRLFHTELEAVYEEFNMGQDNINRRINKTQGEALFPTHPYGQQTTIGTSEHLKSPSMVAIHNYFNTYYVPNNYAVILVGDLEYDETIAMVDKYFGNKKAKPVPQKTFPREKPIEKPVVRELYSKDAENIYLTYRFDGGTGSKDDIYISLIDMLLTNGKAGLIDLSLNQGQKVFMAGCSPLILKEYSLHSFYGIPKEGQTLEQVKELLLEQIERIKKGDFPDWLLEAVVNDLELSEIASLKNAGSIAEVLCASFIQERPWSERVSRISEMRKVTKADIVAFANKHYGNNYVEILKRQGENEDLIRVEKPAITPLEIDRSVISEFGTKILSEEAPRIKPLFVDYQKEIKKESVKGHEIDYIINPDNDLFHLYFIFDMGSSNDKKVELATSYLNFLGTDKLSPEEVKQEFYKLGIDYSVSTGQDRTYLMLSGLGRNMGKGVKLFEELLANVKPDSKALQEMIALTLKDRKEEKNDKNRIFNAATAYAMFGEVSARRDILSREELMAIQPEELTAIIKDLTNYKHRIFYYGNRLSEAKNALSAYHHFGQKEYPTPVIYKEQPTGGKVYYTDYDMVQAQINMIRRVKVYDPREEALALMFNAYFGGGMSSIVFQEIREAKSLAYSAYAFYSRAKKKEGYNHVIAFIGTQSNKLTDAFHAMQGLVQDMPQSEKSFEAAKNYVLQEIESQRITKDNIFWSYEGLKRKGIHQNNAREIYEEVKKITMQDLLTFFNETIKGNDYTFVLIGRESDLPLDLMRQLGTVEKLDIDYIFNNKE